MPPPPRDHLKYLRNSDNPDVEWALLEIARLRLEKSYLLSALLWCRGRMRNHLYEATLDANLKMAERDLEGNHGEDQSPQGNGALPASRAECRAPLQELHDVPAAK